jgi:hypothetical protein
VVDKDDMDIYDPDMQGKQLTTWGVYKNRLQKDNPNVDISTLQDYKNNIPIQLKIGDKEFNAYLHTVSWINEENISENILEDATNLRNIRNGIIANGGTYKTTVKEITNGVLFTLTDNKKNTLLEAVGGDKNYTIGIYDGANIKIGRDKVFKSPVVNSKMTTGATYLVVKGKNGYIAINTFSTKIGNSTHKDSIKQMVISAIDAHLTDNEQVRDEIYSITGLDIFKFEHLEKFLKMYLGFYNTHGNFLRDSIQTIPHGIKNTYFTVHSKTIEFFDGRLGEDTGRVYSISKNKQEKKELFLDKLYEALDNFYMNNSIEAFDSNQIIPIFDENNKLVPKPYRELIMENFTTSVKGNKVDEVDGKPIYSYTLQSVYRFDFNEFLPKDEVVIEDKPTEPALTKSTPKVESKEDIKNEFSKMKKGRKNFNNHNKGLEESQFIGRIKNSHKNC